MLNKPDLRFRLKDTFLECLVKYIDLRVEHFATDTDSIDDDRLWIAALWEVRNRINVKLAGTIKNEYIIKLSPAQSLSLRILYTSCPQRFDQWFGNELRKISDRVDRHYVA